MEEQIVNNDTPPAVKDLKTSETETKKLASIMIIVSAILFLLGGIALVGYFILKKENDELQEASTISVNIKDNEEVRNYNISLDCGDKYPDFDEAYLGYQEGESFICKARLQREAIIDGEEIGESYLPGEYFNSIQIDYGDSGIDNLKIEGNAPYLEYEIDYETGKILIKGNDSTRLLRKGIDYYNYDLFEISGTLTGNSAGISLKDGYFDTYGYHIKLNSGEKIAGVYDPEKSENINMKLGVSNYAIKKDGEKIIFYKMINGEYSTIGEYILGSNEELTFADLKYGYIRVGNPEFKYYPGEEIVFETGERFACSKQVCNAELILSERAAKEGSEGK